MGARFRELLRGPEPLVCPAAYDALSARLIELEGFKGIFVGTSAAASIDHTLPDVGMLSITEAIEFAGRIAAVVDIPTLADADDFGGTPLSVYRHAKALEKAGAGAVMFDDRTPLTRSGGAYGVLPQNQMVDNIRAAADARVDLVLIVRCYAESVQENLERGVAYGEAGADVLYLGGGLRSSEDYVRAANAVKKPLMTTLNANMQVSRMKEARISVANGGSLVNIALGAVDKALVELKTTGVMTEAAKGTLGRDLALKLTRTQEIDERSRKYNITR